MNFFYAELNSWNWYHRLSLFFTEDNVKKTVSPHFSSGLLSLESFVEILDKTPHDISVAAAKRMMPNLLGLVNDAHKAFQNAESTVQEINDKMDDELQDIVVQEKATNDHLCKTQEDLAKLEERGKALEKERSDLEQELSNHEANLRSSEGFLQENKDKLERTKAGRVVNAVSSTANTVMLGLLTGGIGLVVGATVGGLNAAAIEKDIKKYEEAVSEASRQVSNTQSRINDKKSELSKVADEKKKQRKNQTTKSKELEAIKLRKEEIKDSQQRLGRLNESIKSCAMLVGTTTTRANMMAIEANGELPDIEAMIVPLTAIARDLSEASLSNSRLLSGSLDMTVIGCKIRVITSKTLKAISPGDMDQWAWMDSVQYQKRLRKLAEWKFKKKMTTGAKRI